MTKTNLSTTIPLECDLPIIHLLDVRRFSREGMIGFVKSFDGNGTGMFFFRRFFFNQIFYAKVEIVHKNNQPSLAIA
jgi:hypothetical protein